MSETPEPAVSETPEPVASESPAPVEPSSTTEPTSATRTPVAPSAPGRGRATLIAATLVYFAWSLVIGVLATRNDWSPLPRLIRFVLGILLWIAIWKGHRWARLTMGALACVGIVGGSILAYVSGLLVLAKASPLVLVAWALLFDPATRDYVASRRRTKPRT